MTQEDSSSRHLQHINDCRKAREQAEVDFTEAILHASQAGHSQRQIGEAADLSHARIGQIIRQYGRGY
jgi:hypothetical protein